MKSIRMFAIATTCLLLISLCANTSYGERRPTECVGQIDDSIRVLMIDVSAFGNFITQLSDSLQRLGNVPRSTELIDSTVTFAAAVTARANGVIVQLDKNITEVKNLKDYKPAAERMLAMRILEDEKKIVVISITSVDYLRTMALDFHSGIKAPNEAESEKYMNKVIAQKTKLDKILADQDAISTKLETSHKQLEQYIK